MFHLTYHVMSCVCVCVCRHKKFLFTSFFLNTECFTQEFVGQIIYHHLGWYRAKGKSAAFHHLNPLYYYVVTLIIAPMNCRSASKVTFFQQCAMTFE